MNLKHALCIAAIALALLPGVCPAEFYRYTDENGVTRFTDNLGEIPPDQRPKTYEGVNDSLTPEQRAAKEAKKTARDAARQEKLGLSQGAPLSSNTDKAFAALKAQEQALLELENKLRVEQAALIKERNEAKTSSEQESINKKMMQLNEKIKAYDQKQQQHMKKVDAYNRMLQSQGVAASQ